VINCHYSEIILACSYKERQAADVTLPVRLRIPLPPPFAFSYLIGVMLLQTTLAVSVFYHEHYKYKGADKSLARPGRKQATATEDFDFHIPYL
jgi:hypothetical protein